MAKTDKYNLSEVLAGAATVAAGTGTAVALSSHTTATLLSVLSSSYGEAYDDGRGLKGVALRVLPGIVATSIGVAVAGPATMTGAVVGALGLGGAIIGALAPVAEEQVGARIADKLLAWRAKQGTAVATGGVGGPRLAAASAMNALQLPSSTQVSDLYVGGPDVSSLYVGGPQDTENELVSMPL